MHNDYRVKALSTDIVVFALTSNFSLCAYFLLKTKVINPDTNEEEEEKIAGRR